MGSAFGAALVSSQAQGIGPVTSVAAAHRTRLPHSPFTLGVASGYPHATGMVLWTRLLTDPAHSEDELTAEHVPVLLEIADDEAMTRIVQTRKVHAERQWAHSVHAEIDGLLPARWYWYRFTVGGHRSAVGRTRTAPHEGDYVARLRAAFACCQHFEQGYFTAYRQMVADDLDLIVHLGDYIYEGSFGDDLVRPIPEGTAYTLADYRALHARYRTDPHLQAAHAFCPWLCIWDDHEVENDYIADLSAYHNDRAVILARRAAGYQAYYEHLPLPAAMKPVAAGMRIHREVRWGALARFFMLDGRQYRSSTACSGPPRAGGEVIRREDCAGLRDPARTYFGAQQRDWLLGRLPEQSPSWNLLAMPTVFANTGLARDGVQRLYTDSWNAYPVEREQIAAGMSQPAVRNPVVFSGDMHVFFANRVHADESERKPAVATEFTCSSITTRPPSRRYVDAVRDQRGNVRYANGDSRGYVRVDLDRHRMVVDMMGVDDIRDPLSTVTRIAGFVVASELPEPQAQG